MASPLTTKFGYLAISILILGTVAISVSMGFIVFFWSASCANPLWYRVASGNMVNSAVTLLAEVVRNAINLQLGVSAAMIAAIVLEQKRVLLPQAGPCLGMRASYGTWNIAKLLWCGSPWRGRKAGILPSAVTALTFILFYVACIIQAGPILLISDIGLGAIQDSTPAAPVCSVYLSNDSSGLSGLPYPLSTLVNVPVRSRGFAIVSISVGLHLLAVSGVAMLFARECELCMLGCSWQHLIHGSRGDTGDIMAYDGLEGARDDEVADFLAKIGKDEWRVGIGRSDKDGRIGMCVRQARSGFWEAGSGSGSGDGDPEDGRWGTLPPSERSRKMVWSQFFVVRSDPQLSRVDPADTIEYSAR